MSLLKKIVQRYVKDRILSVVQWNSLTFHLIGVTATVVAITAKEFRIHHLLKDSVLLERHRARILMCFYRRRLRQHHHQFTNLLLFQMTSLKKIALNFARDPILSVVRRTLLGKSHTVVIPMAAASMPTILLIHLQTGAIVCSKAL